MEQQTSPLGYDDPSLPGNLNEKLTPEQKKRRRKIVRGIHGFNVSNPKHRDVMTDEEKEAHQVTEELGQ